MRCWILLCVVVRCWILLCVVVRCWALLCAVRRCRALLDAVMLVYVTEERRGEVAVRCRNDEEVQEGV